MRSPVVAILHNNIENMYLYIDDMGAEIGLVSRGPPAGSKGIAVP